MQNQRLLRDFFAKNEYSWRLDNNLTFVNVKYIVLIRGIDGT